MTRAVHEPLSVRRQRRTKRRSPAIRARHRTPRLAIVDVELPVAHRGVVAGIAGALRVPEPTAVVAERGAHLPSVVGAARWSARTARRAASLPRLRTDELLSAAAVGVIHPQLRAARRDDVLPVRCPLGREVVVRLPARHLRGVALVGGDGPQVPAAVAVAHEHYSFAVRRPPWLPVERHAARERRRRPTRHRHCVQIA